MPPLSSLWINLHNLMLITLHSLQESIVHVEATNREESDANEMELS